MLLSYWAKEKCLRISYNVTYILRAFFNQGDYLRNRIVKQRSCHIIYFEKKTELDTSADTDIEWNVLFECYCIDC